MRKRIYVYEMDCYKQASEEQIGKMHIRPDRYFDLEGLPTEEISRLLEEFIWDRGKKLAPSSLSSELLYYNNIRDFLIDRNIRTLDAKAEEKIIRMLKGWMMENGYALSSKKYRALYDRIGIETPGIVKHRDRISPELSVHLSGTVRAQCCENTVRGTEKQQWRNLSFV